MNAFQLAYHKFYEMIETSLNDRSEEITLPYVVRGMLILLLNPALVDPDYHETLNALVQSFEIILSTDEDSVQYF